MLLHLRAEGGGDVLHLLRPLRRHHGGDGPGGGSRQPGIIRTVVSENTMSQHFFSNVIYPSFLPRRSIDAAVAKGAQDTECFEDFIAVRQKWASLPFPQNNRKSYKSPDPERPSRPR